MNTKKRNIFPIFLALLLAALNPHVLAAEVAHEAFTSSATVAEATAQTGVSGITGGQMIYTSALSSRIIPENPLVPLEVHYSVDIASADPEQPISAIVSTLFKAKSVTVTPNNSTASTLTTDIEDRTRVAGQISRIMKEFDYIFPLIS